MLKFADQEFKTTVALVELHKTRTGTYPDKISEIKYTGDWDMLTGEHTVYQKIDDGYTLSITQFEDELIYPDDFYEGLGLIREKS